MEKIVDLLFEIGSLKRIKRGSYQMLGMGDTDIASHSLRTAVIGFFLAKSAHADADKVLKMGLFHDFAESRVGDLNSINKRYVVSLEKKAFYDLLAEDKDTKEIYDLYIELYRQETKEALLCHDADILEQLLEEKEMYDNGNLSLRKWMDYSIERLKTQEGKKLGKLIVKSNSHTWWKKILAVPPLQRKKLSALVEIIKSI